MESGRIVKAGLIAGLLFLPSTTFGYSAGTTHPALTDETIDFFNHFYQHLALTLEEKELVKLGSSEEDHPVTRVVNHFYDPIYNRGLTRTGGVSAKVWAEGTLLQSENTQLVGGAGLLRPHFSGGADYSWERAVYDYVHGDKERALKNLGHILHLIQDATVPDHTRNDMHPPAFDFGSPYEAWTSRFTPENFTIWSALAQSRERPVLHPNLDQYFDEVALFSNQNFFSKDTILHGDYFQPQIEYERSEIAKNGGRYIFGMKQILGSEAKLVRVKKVYDLRADKTYSEYSIELPGQPILSGYWDILSKQAVVYGAGVVKLFFDEVEKERQTQALLEKNESWLNRQIAKALVVLGRDESTAEQLASVIVATEDRSAEKDVSENISPEPADEDVKLPMVPERSIEVPEGNEIEELEQKAEVVENTEEAEVIEESDEVVEGALEEVEDDTEDDIQEEPAPVDIPVGEGGGGGGHAPDTSSPREPTITSPVGSPKTFATTTVSLSGEGEVGARIVLEYFFSGATTTVETFSDGGEWSFEDLLFEVGTTSIQLFSIDDAGNISDVFEETVVVVSDTDPPVAPTLSILQCTYSLRADACLSASESIDFSWTDSGPYVDHYALVKDDVVVTTVTGTSSVISISDGTTATLSVAAVDSAGNAATSTTQQVEVFTSPVVINEIAWAGTEASVSDEWIELYNRTDHTLTLDDVLLLAQDGAPEIALSGTLVTDAFYLIERTDDDTTSVAADLVVAFSGSSGSGLSNSGEEIHLSHALGGLATTTLDETPAVATCGGWCAGDSATVPLSMERADPDADGAASESWASNDTFTKNGTDADGNTVNGTPGQRNSTNLLAIGYFCQPDTVSYEEGSFHEPPETAGCTYLSSEFPSNQNRFGDLYKGTVASSTIVIGHSLNKFSTKNETDSFAGAEQGDDYFTAIYVNRSGFDDFVGFREFFQTGENPPPHLDYGLIRWVYGVAP